VLADVVYMTSVRVDDATQPAWDAFYDDWVDVFVTQVPATRRGARWRVTAGLFDGQQPLPPRGWPMRLATMEYARLDEFVLSRTWRRAPEWEPRVRSFRPWFPNLQDYATLNLQSIGKRILRDSAELGQAVFVSTWTIDPADLTTFDVAYEQSIVPRVLEGLPETIAVHRYVAVLAQLHRYGGADGNLVVPNHHHIEDGKRLCYATLFELANLAEASVQERVLSEVQSRLSSWQQVIADRQDVFAERMLVIEHPTLLKEEHP
jgi:hypothetical protein